MKEESNQNESYIHLREYQQFQKYVDQRFCDNEKLRKKIADDIDKRFISVNEFRGTLSDQATHFLTRNEYNRAHNTLVEKFDTLSKMMAELQGRTIGGNQMIAYLIGVVGMFAGIVTAVAFVLKK